MWQECGQGNTVLCLEEVLHLQHFSQHVAVWFERCDHLHVSRTLRSPASHLGYTSFACLACSRYVFWSIVFIVRMIEVRSALSGSNERLIVIRKRCCGVNGEAIWR